MNSQPSGQPDDPSELPASSPATPSSDAEAASEQPSPAEPAATEAATPESPEPAASEPSGGSPFRVQIGSLGDVDATTDAKPMPTVAEPSPEVKAALEEMGNQPQASQAPAFPKPNVSDQLPEDLQQEVDAALDGISLDDMLDQNAVVAGSEELEVDARVTGKVASVHREDVFIELGANRQGAVPLRQFEEPPSPGTEVELVVVRYNAVEGLYELGVPGAAIEVEDWSDLEEGAIVQATVTGHNKGGLECTVNNLRAFMPMSQIALYRIEDLDPLLGQSFTCLVTEANPEKRNLVISRRAILEREKAAEREKMLENLAVGQEYEGTVRSLQNFGAFVDLGGVDGLIHISKLSWERIHHPSEVLELGQKVQVRIEKYDRESGKIGLAYLDRTQNPWTDVEQKYPIGQAVSGTVSKLMDFGAFVKLEPGVEGLIHISELAHQRVHRTSDVVSEGQTVDVQVLSVDPEKQRIGLSLKALSAAPVPTNPDQQREEQAIAEIEAAKSPRKKHQGPLKGGLGGPSGGDQFGLKW